MKKKNDEENEFEDWELEDWEPEIGLAEEIEIYNNLKAEREKMLKDFEASDKTIVKFVTEYFKEPLEKYLSKKRESEESKNITRYLFQTIITVAITYRRESLLMEHIVRYVLDKTKLVVTSDFLYSTKRYEKVLENITISEQEEEELSDQERLRRVVVARTKWLLIDIWRIGELDKFITMKRMDYIERVPTEKGLIVNDFSSFKITLSPHFQEFIDKAMIREAQIENELVQYDKYGQLYRNDQWLSMYKIPQIEIDLLEGKTLSYKTVVGYLSDSGTRTKKRPKAPKTTREEVAYLNKRNAIPLMITDNFYREKMKIVQRRAKEADKQEQDNDKYVVLAKSRAVIAKISELKKKHSREGKPFYLRHSTDKVGRIYDVEGLVRLQTSKYIAEMIVPYGSNESRKFSKKQGKKLLKHIYASIGELVQKTKHNYKDRVKIGRRATTKYRKKKKLNIKKLEKRNRDEKHLIHLIDLVDAAIHYEQQKYISIALNLDATNQALQLQGVLNKDINLLQNVNIGGDDKFRDSYQIAADFFQQRIIGEKKLDRSDFKKPVMTIGYGSSSGVDMLITSGEDKWNFSEDTGKYINMEKYMDQCAGLSEKDIERMKGEKTKEEIQLAEETRRKKWKEWFRKTIEHIGESIFPFNEMCKKRTHKDRWGQINPIILPDGFIRYSLANEKERNGKYQFYFIIPIYRKNSMDTEARPILLKIKEFINYKGIKPLNYAANFIHSFDAYIARTLFLEGTILNSQHDSFRVWVEDVDTLKTRYIKILESIANSDILEQNDKIWEETRLWGSDIEIPKNATIDEEKDILKLRELNPEHYRLTSNRRTKQKIVFKAKECIDALT